jgi:hypothetical protein
MNTGDGLGPRLETVRNAFMTLVAYLGSFLTIVGFGWLATKTTDNIALGVVLGFGALWILIFLRMRRMRIEIFDTGIVVYNYLETVSVRFEHWVKCSAALHGLEIRTDNHSPVVAPGFGTPSWGPRLYQRSMADDIAEHLNELAAAFRGRGMV